MSAFEFLAIVLLLIITPTMVMSYRVLSRMEKQAIELAKIGLEAVDSAIHDTAHPIFSAKQIRQVRLSFEHHYKRRIQLEYSLTDGDGWPPPDNAPLSEATQEKMREVCAAIVDTECSWKEYAFMISANLRVASRGEASKDVLEEWRAVQGETRGSSALYAHSLSQPKYHRVNEFLGPWVDRLRGEKRDGPSEELFNGPWENRDELIGRFRYDTLERS